MANSTINYVKFLRGTPAAWEKVTNKDNNTLYFISEPTAEVGSLYLGSKLISGGTSLSTLADLTDVSLDTETLDNNSFLVYNSDSEVWENRTLSELSNLLGIESSIYQITIQDNEDSLEKIEEEIPSPLKNDIVIVTKGMRVLSYIYDVESESWINLSNDLEISEDVFMQNSVGKLSLLEFDNAKENDIAFKTSVGKLDWKPISDLPAFQEVKGALFGDEETSEPGLIAKVGALEDLVNNDTSGLKAIQGILFDSEDEDGERVPGMVTDVTNLKLDVADLQEIVNTLTGTESIEGSFVTTLRFNTVVGDITQLSSNNSNIVSDLNDIHSDITNIYETLQW